MIGSDAIAHWIENFYGYGSWQARIWFVAYEEGGGEIPEEVSDKLSYFHRVHPANEATLCDIRDLYQHVAAGEMGPKGKSFDSFYDYRFGQQAMPDSLWNNLIAFTHGFLGKKLSSPLAYQQQTFLSPSLKTEAMLRLYPLPSPHNHAWYYRWLGLPIDYLKSREAYEKRFYLARMTTILAKAKQYKPRLILMYGMNNVNSLKQSVLETFPDAVFKQVKAIKLEIPQHHRIDLSGTTMVITTQVPTLRHNRAETAFNWEKFGTTLRGVSGQ
jgi:hypothetical protein